MGAKLNVDQKTIGDLFQDRRADFLIPDYQRPYAWGETECQTLWEDVFSFAIPDDGRTKFDSNSEYFLGPIVTFKNNDAKMDVLDGQQRLTTLVLMLRAFYARFDHMQDDESKETQKNIGKCIWKTNEFGKPDKSALKIDSEVATDEDKKEFLNIADRQGRWVKKVGTQPISNFSRSVLISFWKNTQVIVHIFRRGL